MATYDARPLRNYEVAWVSVTGHNFARAMSGVRHGHPRSAGRTKLRHVLGHVTHLLERLDVGPSIPVANTAATGDDCPVNKLRCVDGTHAMSEIDGRLARQTTYARIEFEIDGRELHSYVVDEEGRPLASGDVTVYDSGLAEPVAILQGAPFDADPQLTASGRSPILMCLCGDPYCGALLARIEIAGGTVTWTDWVWDHFYEPARPAINIPDFTFDLDQYSEQMRQAAARSRAPRPISIVEAPWWDPILDYVFPERRERPRQILRRHLAGIEARAVTPSLADADGDYADFLAALAEAQAFVAGWHSRNAPRTPADRARTIEALKSVRGSAFVDRLPWVTIDAIDWFLDNVSAGASPPPTTRRSRRRRRD